MMDNNLSAGGVIGSLKPDDDPELEVARRKTLLIAADACLRQDLGREQLRDLVLALGLDRCLTEKEREILSIRD